MSRDLNITAESFPDSDAKGDRSTSAETIQESAKSNKTAELLGHSEGVIVNFQQVTVLLCAIDLVKKIAERDARALSSIDTPLDAPTQRLLQTQFGQRHLVITGLAAIGVQLNEEIRKSLMILDSTEERRDPAEDSSSTSISSVEPIRANLATIDECLVSHIKRSVEELESMRDKIRIANPERRAQLATEAVLRAFTQKNGAA